MPTTDDGIQMDYTHVPATVTGVFRFNDPQPSGTIGLSTNCSIPVDEGAWVFHISKRELEEKVNLGHSRPCIPGALNFPTSTKTQSLCGPAMSPLAHHSVE